MIDETEKEAFERFKDIVPKNRDEWYGSVVMYDASIGMFFNIAFGCGDNLDDGDFNEGYDDYIMVERYSVTQGHTFDEVVISAKEDGSIDSDTEGVFEEDGGQLLLKRSEWTDGDIRRFIIKAMDFIGFGDIDDVIYIASSPI